MDYWSIGDVILLLTSFGLPLVLAAFIVYWQERRSRRTHRPPGS
jgi:CHASE3 domain sensor protein